MCIDSHVPNSHVQFHTCEIMWIFVRVAAKQMLQKACDKQENIHIENN
jgi:hypothetical protein